MHTIIVEVNNKKNIPYVIDLIKLKFGEVCKHIDPTEEDRFSKVIQVTFKRNFKDIAKILKIKEEIFLWTLVKDVLDDVNPKILKEQVIKYCELFTLKLSKKKTERDVHKQLYSYLEGKLGTSNIAYEKTEINGHRPDIIIKKQICIELKIPKKRGEIQRIFGQINDYKKLSYSIVLLMISNSKYNKKQLCMIKDDLVKLFEIHVIIRS